MRQLVIYKNVRKMKARVAIYVSEKRKQKTVFGTFPSCFSALRTLFYYRLLGCTESRAFERAFYILFELNILEIFYENKTITSPVFVQGSHERQQSFFSVASFPSPRLLFFVNTLSEVSVPH